MSCEHVRARYTVVLVHSIPHVSDFYLPNTFLNCLRLACSCSDFYHLVDALDVRRLLLLACVCALQQSLNFAIFALSLYLSFLLVIGFYCVLNVKLT